MMTFLNPFDVLIPKIPFSFPPLFWVTSEARVSVSVGFWGSRQLSPFWGGDLASPPPPPPPPIESPSNPFVWMVGAPGNPYVVVWAEDGGVAKEG